MEGYDGDILLLVIFLSFNIGTEVATSSNNFIVCCIAQAYPKVDDEYYCSCVFCLSLKVTKVPSNGEDSELHIK